MLISIDFREFYWRIIVNKFVGLYGTGLIEYYPIHLEMTFSYLELGK